MKKREFYIEYFNRTNATFSDKIIWGKKEREEAWRKGQSLISKLERKILIVTQYLTLILCFTPMCFDRGVWIIVPIALLFFLLQTFITDFSIIKIELLYSIYRKNTVYSSVLYDIFLGNFTDFLDELKRKTKKEVMGYIFKSGGKFYGKYCAVCRNKNNKITLTFKRNSVVVMLNEKTLVIKEALLNKEHLISEIATIINANK